MTGNVGITATQLKLKPGDVVEVLERYPVGYWRGRYQGKEGIFDAECCVPCGPNGEPLEAWIPGPISLPPTSPKPRAEAEDQEIPVAVEDAETSDSEGSAALKGMATKRAGDESPVVVGEDDSVSLSFDPRLLDSIGESPRGVRQMISNKRNNRLSTDRNSQPKLSPVTASSSSPYIPPPVNVPDDQRVSLNIGGKYFTTTLVTLRKYPDSMLAVMFSGRFGANKPGPDGAHFIDRDGTNFRYILNFLRDGTVVLPDDPRKRKEILKEAIYYQLPQLVKDILRSGSRDGLVEYLTVRYLPGSTYDGWPIRIEGNLHEDWVRELNGDGGLPPERENDPGVRNMFGRMPVWKLRGVLLTSIFNVLSLAGWKFHSSNGSGAGVEPKITFAEMYVFTKTVFSKYDTIHTRKIV